MCWGTIEIARRASLRLWGARTRCCRAQVAVVRPPASLTIPWLIARAAFRLSLVFVLVGSGDLLVEPFQVAGAHFRDGSADDLGLIIRVLLEKLSLEAFEQIAAGFDRQQPFRGSFDASVPPISA